MLISFRNTGTTEDIFDGKNSKADRQVCPQQLWEVAARKLEQLGSAVALDDLLVPPSNRLEVLKCERIGQHRIRVSTISIESVLSGQRQDPQMWRCQSAGGAAPQRASRSISAGRSC